jgi:hypothetical protein
MPCELQFGQLLLCPELRAVRILRCKMHQRSSIVQNPLRRPKITLAPASNRQQPSTSLETGGQAAPVRERTIFAQHMGAPAARLTNAWHSARPHTVLPAKVKPDYRGCEQLPRRMRSSIVITPAFHSAGMHGVDRVTVTSRPHRVVVSAGQPIRCQSCFCSRISPQRRSAQDTVLFHAIALSFLMARS